MMPEGDSCMRAVLGLVTGMVVLCAGGLAGARELPGVASGHDDPKPTLRLDDPKYLFDVETAPTPERDGDTYSDPGQPAGPPPTPRHTGVHQLLRDLVEDFKHLPSKE